MCARLEVHLRVYYVGERGVEGASGGGLQNTNSTRRGKVFSKGGREMVLMYAS